MGRCHTFLFVDLVGFTALCDAEGDDRAADVAVALQQQVRSLLPCYSATEIKALGDGLMVHCSEPTSAVRLGLRIVDRMASDPAFPAVRVGIHSGPAVAREGDWYGKTVNVAARLCSVAEGGDVLVSETTRDAVGTMPDVRFGAARLHRLRNLTEPVAAYSASRRRCRPHQFDVMAQGRPARPWMSMPRPKAA